MPWNYGSVLQAEYQAEGLAVTLKQVTAWKLPSYVNKLPKLFVAV